MSRVCSKVRTSAGPTNTKAAASPIVTHPRRTVYSTIIAPEVSSMMPRGNLGFERLIFRSNTRPDLAHAARF